jgi:hypothetical protein
MTTTTATKAHRYVVKCKRCKAVSSYTSTTAPDRYGHSTQWSTCGCGKQQLAKVVKGHYSARVACNQKCMEAASADCTCECGGLNHASHYEET